MSRHAPAFPPLLAPATYYRALLTQALTRGGERPALTVRDYMRYRIYGPDGRVQLLSVPVAGGASAIKNGDPESWIISDHGRWPDVHIGAIDAAYSSTPYHQHLMPLIEPLLRRHPASARELAKGLHAVVTSTLALPDLLPSLRRMVKNEPELYESKRRDYASPADLSMSILHLLMHLGPETIFALLPPLKQLAISN